MEIIISRRKSYKQLSYSSQGRYESRPERPTNKDYAETPNNFSSISGDVENIYNLIPNKENFISGIGVVSIICVAKLININALTQSVVTQYQNQTQLYVVSLVVVWISYVLNVMKG